MAVYAIGDVQGCFRTLKALLAKLDYAPGRDRIWLVGDLVNRGPSSVDVLRWAASAGPSVDAVLGNHDLHLLRRLHGIGTPKKRDTMDGILAAPDRAVLMGWLRERPLVARVEGYVLVHAGFAPQWTMTEAEELAREIERTLRGEDGEGAMLELLSANGKTPKIEWNPSAAGTARKSAALGILTTVRMCDAQRRVDTTYGEHPKDAPAGLVPWFAVPSRRSEAERIVFGHWSALGFYQGHGVTGLDTGCVWGRSLTAMCLDDGRVTSVGSMENAPV